MTLVQVYFHFNYQGMLCLVQTNDVVAFGKKPKNTFSYFNDSSQGIQAGFFLLFLFFWQILFILRILKLFIDDIHCWNINFGIYEISQQYSVFRMCNFWIRTAWRSTISWSNNGKLSPTLATFSCSAGICLSSTLVKMLLVWIS